MEHGVLCAFLRQEVDGDCAAVGFSGLEQAALGDTLTTGFVRGRPRAVSSKSTILAVKKAVETRYDLSPLPACRDRCETLTNEGNSL